MTRCKEAYEAYINAKKIQGQMCEIKRGKDVGYDMDAYYAFVSDMSEKNPLREAIYCNFPCRAFFVVAREKEGEIREAALEKIIERSDNGIKTNVSDARKILKQLRGTPEFPEGKYNVIYADPPWEYSNTGFYESAEQHYPTMSVEEIKDLSVADLAAEPCVLMLWATSPLLPEALEVMDAWGFEYKANRVWLKPSAPMMGWWVRTKHELLLVGTANGLAHPSNMVDSIIQAPVTEHSKKPESVYVDIEECYPGSKIELFARKARDGWTSWGNAGV